MTTKYWKIITIILIFLFSSFFHFLYELYPSFITSIFSGVNESIWEHNKIIYSSYLLLTIIEKIIYKKKNIIYNNFISMITCSIITISVFTPVYFYILNYKENMIITFSIFIISIIISQYINIKLFYKKFNQKKEIFAIFLYIIITIILVYLTYNPLDFKIFKDYS